jgi:hypothetical protein
LSVFLILSKTLPIHDVIGTRQSCMPRKLPRQDRVLNLWHIQYLLYLCYLFYLDYTKDVQLYIVYLCYIGYLFFID